MASIAAHLEQISYCCEGIAALPFPQPRIFTNALLSNHDITSLIRDTEPHERALFSVPPPPPPPHEDPLAQQQQQQQQSKRRQTVFSVASGEVITGPPPTARSSTTTGHPRRHTAVAAVLGGEMHDRIRRGEAGGSGGESSSSADRKGDVDVDILLQGAEKLCTVYELPGARERIAAIGARHRDGKGILAYYEAKVAQQAEQLASQNREWMEEGEDDEEGEEEEMAHEQQQQEEVWTGEDLRREEEEARAMERKKKELQTRLRAMEKDLGGLMRMR